MSTASNNAKYFKNVYRGSSAHYFVDGSSIYQVVEDTDVAWHCGGKKYYHKKCRNSNSIGVEMCLKSGYTISDKTIANTAELVKMLMKKYNIPAENVLRHYDITHKLCPAPYVDAEKWIALRKRLTSDKMEKEEKTEKINYVKVIFAGNDKNGLAIRKTPSWKAKPVQYVKEGTVFTVVKKVAVGDSFMYQLKSGLYITASSKYVKYFSV